MGHRRGPSGPVRRCPANSCCQTSDDLRFSAAVAAFAQQLKGDGRYTGSMSLQDTAALARSARGDDPFGLRNEFVQLVELAQSLKR